MKLTEMQVGGFVEQVASDSPAPGGGSVAALMAAGGAALLAMVAKLTVGKKKYQEHDALMREVSQKADGLARRLSELVDEDTEAFNKVSAVFSMPKQTDDEKKARTRAMQEALKAAAEVPMTVMETCLESLELAESALGKSNASAASDLGVAALGLLAGIKGAWLNVKINVSGIKDEAYAKGMAEKGGALVSRAEALSAKVHDGVLAAL